MNGTSNADTLGGPSSATVNRASDVYQSLSHLDLTEQVQQTETNPRGGRGLSSVYYGSYQSQGKVVNVAIKRMRVMLPDNDDRERYIAEMLVKELKIWSSLDNPNVLPLLGFTLGESKLPALISEWMDDGTILNYINSQRKADIFLLVKGVASGLAYLHQVDVVHGDMKSDNILISSDGNPLLVDFGISRTLVVTQVVSGLQALMGSVRWMAEELVNPNGYLSNRLDGEDTTTLFENAAARVQTEQTDIWAFGMVIYELLTCAHPFNGLSDIQAWLTIAKGERPQAPIDMDQEPLRHSLWTLCNVCWGEPDDRPPMKDIVLGLNNRILTHHGMRIEFAGSGEGNIHVGHGKPTEYPSASHQSYNSSIPDTGIVSVDTRQDGKQHERAKLKLDEAELQKEKPELGEGVDVQKADVEKPSLGGQQTRERIEQVALRLPAKLAVLLEENTKRSDSVKRTIADDNELQHYKEKVCVLRAELAELAKGNMRAAVSIPDRGRQEVDHQRQKSMRLEEEIKNLHARVELLKVEAGRKQEQHAKNVLQSSIAAQEERARLEQVSLGLRQQSANLQEEIKGLHGRIARLEADVRDRHNEAVAARQEREKWERVSLALRQQLTNLQNENTGLRDRTARLEADDVQLERDRHKQAIAAQQERERWEQVNLGLRQQLTNLRNENTGLRDRIARLEADDIQLERNRHNQAEADLRARFEMTLAKAHEEYQRKLTKLMEHANPNMYPLDPEIRSEASQSNIGSAIALKSGIYTITNVRTQALVGITDGSDKTDVVLSYSDDKGTDHKWAITQVADKIYAVRNLRYESTAICDHRPSTGDVVYGWNPDKIDFHWKIIAIGERDPDNLKYMIDAIDAQLCWRANSESHRFPVKLGVSSNDSRNHWRIQPVPSDPDSCGRITSGQNE